MKYFGLVLLAQAIFGLICVVSSYPEASAGIVFTSLLSCVLVNNDTSSVVLLLLSFFVVLSLMFEEVRDAYIFIQTGQILVSTAVAVAHN